MFHQVIVVKTCSSNIGNFVANLEIKGTTLTFFDKYIPRGESPYAEIPHGDHLVKILANNLENDKK